MPETMTLQDVVVLIPAYQPDEKLLAVVADLLAEGFARIVVVDDGSAAECLPVFARLQCHPQCTLLAHAVNLGKGRALKTGLNHIALTAPGAAGVVTVDADGQHLAADVARVAAAFLERPDALVLGSRRFGRDVPLRSLLGNVVTCGVFRFLVGKKLADTQSGLRCFPLRLVPQFLQLEGERYEYEMNMLIAAHETACIREVGISTVYIEDNRSSHFSPLVDSMKIYFLLLRFSFSSVFTSVIDFLVFALAYALSTSVLLSIVVARLVSGIVNFTLNRSLVFHSSDRVVVAVLKYYALLVLLGAAAYLAIQALAEAGVNVIVAKLLAESLLFLVSFSVQRSIIFTRRGAQAA
jgi:glycosyltransferase involved in cell wall biosynthesis